MDQAALQCIEEGDVQQDNEAERADFLDLAPGETNGIGRAATHSRR